MYIYYVINITCSSVALHWHYPHATIICIFPRGSSSARKCGDEGPMQWRPLSLTGLSASAYRPTRHCKLPHLIKCIKPLVPICPPQKNQERAETLAILSQGGPSDQRAETSSAHYCIVTYKEWNAVDVCPDLPFFLVEPIPCLEPDPSSQCLYSALLACLPPTCLSLHRIRKASFHVLREIWRCGGGERTAIRQRPLSLSTH